jgi:hypothetical protein
MQITLIKLTCTAFWKYIMANDKKNGERKITGWRGEIYPPKMNWSNLFNLK